MTVVPVPAFDKREGADMTRTLSAITLTTALFGCIAATSAEAQVTRTFVSGTGTANSSCSYTAPCRFFTQAVAALPASGGEIDVLDPGSYGQITITNSVSIVGRGWTTITATNSTAAITITGSGNVAISGVQLDGGGTGKTGISFTGGGTLTILDSVARNFASDGITVAPSVSGARVVLRNVALMNNNIGIDITPSNTASVSARNVTASANVDGVYISTASAGVSVSLDHLNASENSGYGVECVGTGANTWETSISSSVLRFNGEGDVFDNSPAESGLSLQDHNKIGNLEISSGVTAYSDGSNNITRQSGGGTLGTQSIH
jgi:hypothetical protein